MRHLILMRHAEASIALPNQTDFERGLTQRGEGTATQQAQFLYRQNLLPDLVLCSPATRTSRTWQIIKENLGMAALPMDFKEQFPDSLYQASTATLHNTIRALPDSVDIALVLGHNVGIHDIAIGLAQPVTGTPPSEEYLRLLSDFPPATMAIFECPLRGWYMASHETITLKHVVRPR